MVEVTRYVSTAQVAAALGVSVSTVKRWVDEDVLPAHRTAGGHRKVLLADVMRLVKENHFPHADLGQLGAPLGSVPAVEDLARQLYDGLRGGDGTAVRSVILGAHQGGMPLETLGDGVVAPALTRIGADWEAGRIDVLHEHRASQLCTAALYELKSRLDTGRRRDRPVAVGGAPEWDPTVVPSLMAQLTLLDAGWDAVNLGPHTPAASFHRALHELRPRLLWLSMTHPLPDVGDFLAEYAALNEEARRLNVAVMLGGRGVTDALRAALTGTTFGQRLSDLVAFARTVHRVPSRPRRGRPPGTGS